MHTNALLIISIFLSAGHAAVIAPEMARVLAEREALSSRKISELPAAEARREPTLADALVKVLHLHKDKRDLTPLPIGKFESRTIRTDSGSLPVRFYWPQGRGGGPYPIVVYFHGGGWSITDSDDYDSAARSLTRNVNCIVMAVEYRQAPEHKFPAAHNDAFAAYLWALRNAASVDGDEQRIAVAGEDAGANLAIGVSLMAREQGQKLPVAQLALYPIASPILDSDSYTEHEFAAPLDKATVSWFFKNYLSKESDADDPRMNLLESNLRGLPPTILLTAGIDPLRSDGERLAARLKAAGVPVEYKNYSNLAHGFFGLGMAVTEAAAAEKFAAVKLQSAFN